MGCFVPYSYKDTAAYFLTLKWLGDQFDFLCGFLKNVSFKEMVKPWLFVTFNIMISHLFSDNYIEIPQVVQNIWRISLSILPIFIDFHQCFRFLAFPCYKETYDVSLLQMMSDFFLFHHIFRLFNNCIKSKIPALLVLKSGLSFYWVEFFSYVSASLEHSVFFNLEVIYFSNELRNFLFPGEKTWHFTCFTTPVHA